MVEMKRIVLVITVVLVLGLGIMSCTSVYQVDQSDIPSYSRSEITAIVRDELYNSDTYTFTWGMPEGVICYASSDSEWELNYIGNGQWEVQCKVQYSVLDTTTGSSIETRLAPILEWVFYEHSRTLTQQ